jgi:hypothetical protein
VAGYQIAQLNIAKLKEPIESPSMADFVGNLDRINTLAERSAGFVWRLKDENESSTGTYTFGDDYVVNMSVWENVDSLSNYAFKSDHVDIMRRRREWFHSMKVAYAVLWWVPAGHRPTVLEAKERLDYLRKHGATEYAFTFKQPYRPPTGHLERQPLPLDAKS